MKDTSAKEFYKGKIKQTFCFFFFLQAFLSLQIWILPEKSQKDVMTVVMDSIILKPELLLTTNSGF